MENFNRKTHWENIYQNKDMKEVSWFQEKPAVSLDFVAQFNLPKTAKIIDIGGGDSFFVDYLLDLGYQNITVLDISEKALLKAQERLGDRAQAVNWIVADAAQLTLTETYDFWHDRAAFHFLTDSKDIACYIDALQLHLKPSGYLVIGTFSENGPKKCSGIEIKQYSEQEMVGKLENAFEKIQCMAVDHQTPFNTSQNFLFCSFKKR